jgi:hypothetical protein
LSYHDFSIEPVSNKEMSSVTDFFSYLTFI